MIREAFGLIQADQVIQIPSGHKRVNRLPNDNCNLSYTNQLIISKQNTEFSTSCRCHAHTKTCRHHMHCTCVQHSQLASSSRFATSIARSPAYRNMRNVSVATQLTALTILHLSVVQMTTFRGWCGCWPTYRGCRDCLVDCPPPLHGCVLLHSTGLQEPKMTKW